MKMNYPTLERLIFTVRILLLLILFTGCHADKSQIVEFAAADNVAEYWAPAIGNKLQIQYAGYPPDLNIEADIYALDLFEAPQSSIEELHAKGKKVICYVNTGAWEEYRPDADDFPSESIGRDYEGWPGEKWLDIGRYETFAGIMQARFDLAVEKDCDGIDADNMQNYEEHTGFNISRADQMEYNLWLSQQAHQRDLSIGLKNDADQAAELAAHFDWSLVEDCSVYGWCQILSPFIEADKPVFQIEYTDTDLSLESFCPTANELGFSALLKHRDLDAWVEFCP